MATGRRNFFSSVLSVLVLGTAIVPASAQSLSVSSGYLDMNFRLGPMLLGGDRGFTFQSAVSEPGGVFLPARCNDDPVRCVPGSTLNLAAHWLGTDLGGTATLDGVTYRSVGSSNSPNQMSVTFSGSATLPPLAASATLKAPFTLTGLFSHATSGSTTAQESLSGGGTATISLVADPIFPGSWRVTRVFYSLNSTIPDGWVTADVGQVGRAGDASFSNGSFVVNGAGANIWVTADSFRFVFQRTVGDADIIARVDAETFTDSFAKAGLMFRASADASDAHVILDVRPDGNVEFMTRSAANGTTTFIAGGPMTLPLWLKLTRSDATVGAAVSVDGNSWTSLGTTPFTTAGQLGGLAVTSRNTSALNEARFSEVRVTTPATSSLPPPWTMTDIGAVGQPGGASFGNGVFTVKSAGDNIWDSADSFTFVSQPTSGDGRIIARVTSLQNTDTFAKAGVMIRDFLAATARHVILDIRPGGFVEFMRRDSEGGETTFITGLQASFPVWLKLERVDGTVTGSISADGTNWTFVGDTPSSVPADARVGLAVTSRNSAALTTATFDQVVVDSAANGVPAPFTSRDVGAVGLPGSASFANGTFTVAGSGANIWGTADGFHYVFAPLIGTTTLTARVTSLQDTSPFA